MIYLEYVIKRDGSQVIYNKDKIYEAISAANEECILKEEGHLTLESLYDALEDIDSRCNDHVADIGVEEIQNIVERVLMSYEPDVARAYIRYRYMKEVAREYKADFFEAIGEKLAAKNVANQNANVDEHSFGGRVGEASDAMMKEYALNFCMSKMAKENHLSNQIYIHDLSAYAVGMHNCLSVPFDHLLRDGFNTRQADIRPANSVDTAFQLLAVIFQLQSLQQFGGVSATHLDWTMVPYVRKSFWKHYKTGAKYLVSKEDYDYITVNILDNLDYAKLPIESYDNVTVGNHERTAAGLLLNIERYRPIYNYAINMTIKEVQQAVEGMYHNLNTLQSRSGNQLKCVAG